MKTEYDIQLRKLEFDEHKGQNNVSREGTKSNYDVVLNILHNVSPLITIRIFSILLIME